MRFVDLFCGPGFATQGLMDAGLTPALGVDSSFVALSGYRFNARGRGMEADIGNLATSDAARIVATRPDLVWMSPPDELRAPVRCGRWMVDEQMDALVLRAVELAARCSPSYIVMERRMAALQLDSLRQINRALRDYGRPEICPINDRLHAGGAQDRVRAYLVWARRGRVRPAITLDDRPGCAADVIDRSLPVSSSTRSMSSRRIEALARLNQLGGGVLVYRRESRGDADMLEISRLNEPHPVLTVRTQLLYVYDGGWRAPSAGEYKRLLGVPDRFDLPGRAPERHRQTSHGTDARVSALIGRSLMSGAER